MADLERVGLIFKNDGEVDYIRSLRNVNTALNENYQQFKLTQSQYDKNTSTAQKLQDRMVFLNGAYDTQKDKVRLLTKELEELEKAEIKDETAINKKKAALAQAETQLNKYGKQLDGVEGKIKSNTAHLEDYKKTLDKVGDGFTDAGKKVSVVGAGIGAALGLSVKSAIDFESAFAGVEKTVDGTESQLADLKKGIRDMALEIPASTTEISNVAEAAGQLGIKTDDVLNFTRVMIDMGESTNLTSEQAATTLAKFANVTRMSSDDFSRLGSTIVSLGNNFATTEADIANMAMNLGSAGAQIGMSQAEIAAFATALSSVGIEAQAGGSAFSKVMIQMQLATETGGEKLKEFASVAGMSADDFTKAFQEDASGAIMSFVEGLSKTGERGESAIKVLDDMGIKEVRLRDALLRSANASELFSDAIKVGSEAWEENIALTQEAETRYKTTESQMKMAKNSVNEIAIIFGDLLLPAFNDFLDKVKEILKWIRELDPIFQKIVLNIGLIIVALGPLLIFIGKVATGISSLLGLFIKLKPMIMPILAGIKAAVAALAAALGISVGWVVAIGVAIGALVVLIVKYWDEIKEFTLNLVKGIADGFNEMVDYLSTIFNSVVSYVSEAVENVKSFFTGMFESIKEVTINVIDNIKEYITNFVSNLLVILDGPIQFVKNALLLLVALFAMFLETIYNNVITPLVNFFTEGFNSIKEHINTIITNVKEFINQSFEWIKQNVITPVVTFLKTAFDKIYEIIQKSIENVKVFFITSFEWIKQSVIQPLTGFFTGVFDSILNIINSVVEKIKGAFRGVSEFVKTTFNNVKNFISGIFESIGDIIKVPINGVIKMINNVLKSLNKIKIPKWVPGVGGEGINFSMIPMLAKGGDLLSGQSIVAEAGPELITQKGNRTTVTPLSDGGGAIKRDLIDYKKMAEAFFIGMSSLKLVVDEDGIAKFVDERMLSYV